MGDPLRERAFDEAYAVSGDVGAAEDYANEAVARSRSRRRLVALVAATSVLLLVAVAVAARRGGGTKTPVRTASAAPTAAGTEATITDVTPTTTTTMVLVQPPLQTAPAAANTPAMTATTTVHRAAPTTIAAAAAPPTTASQTPTITLAEVWPPSRDPSRVYVSARGRDPGGYVNQMTINWGDGTPGTKFDYSRSPCEVGALQAADANHAYAAPGVYRVQLFVQSVPCEGTAPPQLITMGTTVNYPSSPPSG